MAGSIGFPTPIAYTYGMRGIIYVIGVWPLGAYNTQSFGKKSYWPGKTGTAIVFELSAKHLRHGKRRRKLWSRRAGRGLTPAGAARRMGEFRQHFW